MSTLSDMQRAVRDTLRANWQLLLIQGAIMFILGILAIARPGESTIAVDVYIGWLFLFSGFVGLAAMFFADDAPAFLWTLLTAALSLIVGVLLLWHPAEGAVSLTLVLTAFFIVEGVFQIAASISYRDVIPQLVGMDVGKRHRRPDPGGADHRGLAEYRQLGAGGSGRCQFDDVRHGNHHGRACRANADQNAGERQSLMERIASCNRMLDSVCMEI